MQIQQKLKACRLAKGWSQKELAEKMNLTEKAISNYENGHRQIDSDKMEQFGKLFGMEWMKTDKKASNTVIVSSKEMAKNDFILSASHYVNKQKVTLRVDISLGVRKQLEQLAEKESVSLDEMAEKALAAYIGQIERTEKTPVYSEYYERYFALTEEEARIVYTLYVKCCEKIKEYPEFHSQEEMMANGNTLTTALYHVERFGQEDEMYNKIQHLFD